jgi:hypothetical protein
MKPDTHAVEIGRAREAAKRYNDTLKLEAGGAEAGVAP